MRRPSSLIDALRIRKALRDYPIYSPPFPGVSSALPRKYGEANYSYFLQEKSQRLASLQRVLSRFDQGTTSDISDMQTLDKWCHRFAGHLIPMHVLATTHAFHNNVPAWTSEFIGLNAVWDIATCIGEMTIKINPACHWFFYDSQEKRSELEHPARYKPCIGIPRRPGYWDVFTTTLSIMIAKKELITIGKNPHPEFLDYASNAIEKRIQHRVTAN